MSIRRALLSVTDKTGLVDFAARASRATASRSSPPAAPRNLLADAGIAVAESPTTPASPRCMDGRVKTLHPRIHGGLLGRRGTDEAVDAGARHRADRPGGA